jgi:hypothetical protein
MCTLLAVVPPPGGALQVAANRDEFLARPASPPRRWPGVPAILAPRDEQAHGTWLGVNAHGLFVGVTNRHGTERDTGLASRGMLVAEALRADSVDALHGRLASLGARVYNPFHLLYADTSGRAGLTVCDGARLRQHILGPGLHVLTERSFGAGDDAVRVRRAEAALARGGGHLPLEGQRLHPRPGGRLRHALLLPSRARPGLHPSPVLLDGGPAVHLPLGRGKCAAERGARLLEGAGDSAGVSEKEAAPPLSP